MGLSDLALRLKALFHRRRAEEELDEELQFHLEMEARKRALEGAPADDATREARVAFGGVEQAREQCRDARGVSFIENLARDFRFGARTLAKSPGFTAVAVLSLAVGIGANTWIFSVVDRAFLQPLPVRNPQELLLLNWGGNGLPNVSCAGGSCQERGKGGFSADVFSWDAYSQIRARRGALQDAFGFAYFNNSVNVVANGAALPSGGVLISGNLFSALGISPEIGRPIMADEDTAGGAPAVMLGYHYWRSVFDGSPDVLGKTIFVNRMPHVIVGVARRDFPNLLGEARREEGAEIILPLRSRTYLEDPARRAGRRMDGPDWLWVHMMARLKGAPQAAAAEMAAILRNTVQDSAKIAPFGIMLPGKNGPSDDYISKSYREPLIIIVTATALTFLIACANLAGLMLARATRRRKEICLRMSLGASRARVIRQLLCESALVSAAGAALGILLSLAGMQLLLSILAAGGRSLPNLDGRLDWRIALFTGAAFMLATLLFGLAPAWSATRVDLAEGMKQDNANRGSGRSRGITAMVCLQAAVAVTLVTGAGLLSRSLLNLRNVPLGFNPSNVALFTVSPSANGYTEARGLDFYARLTERLRRVPGVTGVTLSRLTPATGWTNSGPVQIAVGAHDHSNFNYVGADYFSVMGMGLVSGRFLDAGDLAASRRVAVVNEAAARFFGQGSPIGRRFHRPGSGAQEYEVVGVVRNAVYSRLRETNPPTIFEPYTKPSGGSSGQMTYLLRTKGSPTAIMPALRAAVRELDPLLPVTDLKTLDDQLDQHLTQERILAFLANLFGFITLGLACMGIYGTVAYSVAARTREIGIRVALGASRAGILRMATVRALAATAAGLAAGAPAAYILQKFMRSQLFAVDPGDVTSLLFAAAAVALAAAAAAWLPARRALRIEPTTALHWE